MKSDPELLSMCDRCRQATERFLEGERDALESGIEAHQAACPSCRADFLAAQRLARGLSLLEKPAPSIELRDRLVATVLSDLARPSSRKTAQRWLQILAMAACILFVVALGFRISKHSGSTGADPSPRDLAATNSAAAPVALEQSFAEASSAMASLTRRTADETVEPAKALLSTATDSAVLKSEPAAGAIQPANESISTMGKGATLGLEPVANSARRAISLFMRDLAVDNQRKGGL